MLDKNKFTPDTTFESQFPWADIIACFDKELPKENFKNHYCCPKCEQTSEELTWIQFSSPDWTWEGECGSEGPLSICPKCKIQVEFILELMT